MYAAFIRRLLLSLRSRVQTGSLKEVVDITKHMLAIRNTEVTRMTEDLESLQGKINEERNRHNAIIDKMNLAAK